jgi:solute:Na+ symporter, SSS family
MGPHGTYDLLVILAAIAGLAFAALRANQGKRGSDASEYFLARRGVGWLSLGVSLFVTSLWAFWSLTQTKPVAEGIWGWLVPGVVVVIGLVALGLGFVPRYKASEATTISSFISERFGRPVGLAVALVSIGLTLFVQIPFTILVGTQMVSALMAWDPMSSGLLMVVIPGLFVVAGGYPSAIAAQTAGGVVAGVGLLFLAANGFPGDGALPKALPEAIASWPSVIACMAIMGSWSMCIEQQVAQRIFAARTPAQGRMGALLAAALVLVGVALLTMASGHSSLSPALGGSSGAAGGFVVAAIIALVMASLSAHFMSVSTLITMDIVRPVMQAAGEAKFVLSGRLTNTVVVILAILTASSLPLTGAVVLEWMVPAAVAIVPPVVAVVLLGLFVPRMHGRGAFWALVAGWVVGVADAATGALAIEGALMTFTVSAVVFVSVSLAVAPLGTLRKVPGTILQVRKP